MPQQRRVFLITYSQADLSIFKDCESFVAAVAILAEWVYCKELHEDGGEHFYMLIKFKSSWLWGPVKEKFMQDYNVSLNFKTKSYGYIGSSLPIC